jgi:hypothetical protein
MKLIERLYDSSMQFIFLELSEIDNFNFYKKEKSFLILVYNKTEYLFALWKIWKAVLFAKSLFSLPRTFLSVDIVNCLKTKNIKTKNRLNVETKNGLKVETKNLSTIKAKNLTIKSIVQYVLTETHKMLSSAFVNMFFQKDTSNILFRPKL